MQRYSRDSDRDAERDRPERRALARDERNPSGRYRDTGGRDEADYEGSYQTAPSGRNFTDERDPFERQHRGTQQGEYEYEARGGTHDRRPHEDDWSDRRGHGGGAAWQPGRQMGDPRRSLYGAHEPEVSGRPYGSSYGGWQRGELPGNRGDDRFGRQGYGQSRWQQEYEGEEQTFDPDYLQWRAEQIRNLDRDYQRYRKERYKKFCDEFDEWRRSQKSMPASSPEANAQGTAAPDVPDAADDFPATAKRDR